MANVKSNKVRCADCAAMWHEGKVQDQKFIVLINIKKNKLQYLCLDSALKTHPAVDRNMLTVACCPACEPNIWELREQHKGLTELTRKEKKAKSLKKTYKNYLYNRLLYGNPIHVLYENEKPMYGIVLDADASYYLFRLSKKGQVHSRKQIPHLQVATWIANYVDALAREPGNRLERIVNEIFILKKAMIKGGER